MKACRRMFEVELAINGHLADKCISFCCYDYKDKPCIGLANDAEETANSIMQMVIRYQSLIKRNLFFCCTNCNLLNDNKECLGDETIRFVNLSAYPSPCQSNCIYCGFKKNKRLMVYTDNEKPLYLRMIKSLELLIDRGHIDNDALWQLSPGEITIHPLRNLFYDFISNKKCIVFTNGFIFDERLASELQNNKTASLNLSIDAGNSATWRKVKGLNNYEIVIENLKKYIDKCYDRNQITLKYILLPGVNDNYENIMGLSDLLHDLKIHSVMLSRDYGGGWKNLDKGAILFEKIMNENGIIIDKKAFE